MASIIAGRLDDLPPAILERLGAFRYRVFVQRLQWEIPGLPRNATSEWDEFDATPTVHLIALSSCGEVCGCARLMPTTGPNLLSDVFPQLCAPREPPSSPSIWELSRFAGTGMPNARLGSSSGMSLFPYAMALAQSMGATCVVGVLTRSVARLYRRFGLDLRDMGIPTAAGDGEIVACSIDLSAAAFHRLQCDPATLLNSIIRVGQISQLEAMGGGPEPD
jgi:N-acyl-L-homoserine lactone synthetase